jgi:polysaccharide biosynthesis protein PslH
LNVLFLAPYLPFPPHGGGKLRMYHLLRLAARRHNVHLLTLAQVEDSAEGVARLREMCDVTVLPAARHTLGRRLRALAFSTTPDMLLRGKETRFAETLASLLGSRKWDVVQAESIEMTQYGRTTGAAQTTSDVVPLYCYDAFNAEYLLQKRAFLTALRQPRMLHAAAYSLVQWHKLRRFEQRLARRFDLLFAVSKIDGRILADLAPGIEIEVVPNGVDTHYFSPTALETTASHPVSDKRGRYLLFTGTLDFRPNVDALSWFVKAMWPELRGRFPSLRLCIAGQRPAPGVQELGSVQGVEVIGPVNDMRQLFADASVYVLPMRIGGGVRLKLLEAWAMGVPCVTTTLGAEGVTGFEPGVHALVADEAEAFAQAVERLLADQTLAGKLAMAGRELVERHYDWQPIFERMEAAWERRLATAPGS